ncbi:MAG: His/Gly/Thr/Pro-type tRNA ligase C-terminal domain-containing protein, partial [Candidatus Caldatribacterium sp.]|nr:His/Gly/Thr/Pro-type tRNA ligase C-terminal domain-containing protein [Candidatus Caldatribacterium sp.]
KRQVYIGEDGGRHRPVVLHRTVLGSVERFFGILIEHFAGAFPVWLSPVQVVVLPVAERHIPYAREVEQLLAGHDIRVQCDEENATLGAKIRRAELEKIPYVLVVGDKEVANRQVSVRRRREGNLGAMELGTFLERVLREIAERVVE